RPLPLTSSFPYTTLFRSSRSDFAPDFVLRMRLIALHDLLEVSDRFGQAVLRAGDAAELIVSIQLFAIDFDRALKAMAKSWMLTIDRKSTRLNSSHQIISY